MGSTSISDRPCEVIPVVARDGSRYSYIVWMDEDTKLSLRVNLLDRDSETLEQYRVISFSDGLFSFSVNISPAGSGAGQQYYRQGRRTIQTAVRNGREIIIVGELPPTTAKRIADNISFRVSPQ